MERLGDISLINDDCMNVLRKLPALSYDLAIVDPLISAVPNVGGFTVILYPHTV